MERIRWEGQNFSEVVAPSEEELNKKEAIRHCCCTVCCPELFHTLPVFLFFSLLFFLCVYVCVCVCESMQWYNTDSETLDECQKLKTQEKQILLLSKFYLFTN
jgi:hypothetical protein